MKWPGHFALKILGLMLLVALLAALAASTGQPAPRSMVAQIALDGPIGPAAAEYFDDASKRAVADGAAAIVLRLDTPGGLADSMRQIIAGMLASPVPVLVYVAPVPATNSRSDKATGCRPRATDQ